MALYLPHDELVSELGDICTKALLGAFGGQRLYIPAVPGPDHPISQALGPANAPKVAGLVAIGMWVQLPCGDDSPMKTARRRLDELVTRGLTTKEIVQELKVNNRTVRRARARLAAA